MHWVKLKPDDVGCRVQWADGSYGIIGAHYDRVFHVLYPRTLAYPGISEAKIGPSFVRINSEGLCVDDQDDTSFRVVKLWRIGSIIEFEIKPPEAK